MRKVYTPEVVGSLDGVKWDGTEHTYYYLLGWTEHRVKFGAAGLGAAPLLLFVDGLLGWTRVPIGDLVARNPDGSFCVVPRGELDRYVAREFNPGYP